MRFFLFIKFLVLNIFVFFCIYIAFPVIFAENDDVIMMMISSGNFSVKPDHHLVFIHIYLGYFISFLETLSSQINWYSLFLSVLLIVSFSLYNTLFWQKSVSDIKSKISVISLSIIGLIFVSLNFQFTLIAGILAGTGACLMIWGRSKLFIFIGVLFFLLGSMLRYHSGMLIILISFPFFTYIHRIKGVICIILLVLTSLFIQYLNNQNYQNDSNWANYYEINKLRGELNDNQRFYDLYNNSSITRKILLDDLKLFNRFFPDPEVFSAENLLLLKSSLFRFNFKGLLKMYYVLPSILVFGGVLIVFFFLDKNRPIYKLLPLISFLIVLLAFLFISFDGRVKDRVIWTAFFPMFFFSILNFDPYIVRNIKFQILNYLLFFLISLLCVYSFFRNENLIKVNNEILSELESSKSKSFILFPFFMNINCFKILENKPKIMEYKIYYSGWLMGVPFENFIVTSFRPEFLNDKYLLISNQDIVRLQNIKSSFNKYGEVELREINKNYFKIIYKTH